MGIWRKTGEAASGLECTRTMTCPFHQNDEQPTVLTLLNCKILHFNLYDKDGNPTDSNAIDVVLICPECGYREIYGVAVSAEHNKNFRFRMQEKLDRRNIRNVTVLEKAERDEYLSQKNTSVGENQGSSGTQTQV